MLLHWTYWSEKTSPFFSGNQIQPKEQKDGLTVGIIEYLKKTGYPFQNHKKYARPGKFLIFSAFLVFISFPVFLHNLHYGSHNPMCSSFSRLFSSLSSTSGSPQWMSTSSKKLRYTWNICMTNIRNPIKIQKNLRDEWVFVPWNSFRIYSKCSERQVWVDSEGAVWSGSILLAILPASFERITRWQSHLVELLAW